MADQYIDEAYCRSQVSEGLVSALTARLGTDLDTVIESATGLIQALLRGHGYSPAAVAADEAVKLATFACVWELLASMPKASLKMPERWDTHPARIAYTGIIANTIELSVPPSTSRGPGGSQWTNTSSTSDNPRRASSDELAGY